MLNKEILTEALCREIYEDFIYLGEDATHIDDIDELHDYLITISINDIMIEDYDALYWKMCEIIQTDGEEIIEEVNEFIDEECFRYYGDPAFSSASDYWHYILG